MTNTDNYKQTLEKELIKLENELSSIGRKNPKNADDWQATHLSSEVDSADRNEVADSIEEYEENTAILKDLEIRYGEVKKALAKIADKTFGHCEICGKAIDSKRLDANPAAKTCQIHMAN